MRSIGLLQIKFPITASKCMVADKCHAYIKGFAVNIQCIIQLSLVYNCISFKFGSIYVFILKLMNFILLIYFYLVFYFCVKILKKFQLFLRQNIISIILVASLDMLSSIGFLK